MLRYRLAWPLLMLNRVKRMLRGARSQPGTFRVLLLHDVPPHQMDGLAHLVSYVKTAHGVLTPDEAARVLDGTLSLPDDGRVPCLFTFDDGFASNATAARQVLDPAGVKALFFVCPGLMAEPKGAAQQGAVAQGIFQGRVAADTLTHDQQLMTMDELRSLQAAGHAIGAHGMRHRRLSDLTGAALDDEITPSGCQLTDTLGGPIDWYAYAFGDIDSISADALGVIAKAHQFCRSGVRGVNGAGTNPLAVRAESLDLAAPLSYAKFILEGGLDARYADARARLDAAAS